MNNDSLETDVKIDNVKVQYTDEHKTILGYDCRKVIISYTMVQLISVDGETILWVTDKIEKPETSQLPQLNKRNGLTDAIAAVSGFPLETEAIMKSNNLRTVTIVKEISVNKIQDDAFEVGFTECKSPLNLKEYKSLLLKRKRQKVTTGYY